MGLLNRADSTIFRQYFNEMVKLIGQSVGYQYVVKQELTIHSEDNSELSVPIRLDVLFDDNPSVDTLNKLGWVSEMNDQKPIIVNMPYNTPKLTVNARIIIESVDGVGRPRVFRITKIQSDLEFPDAFTCALVPVFDQYVQKNQYTLVNTEKINQAESERTSKDQPYEYITNSQNIDTTPEEHIKWESQYTFIDDSNSPYSG
jgi:hypothetical protein